MQQQAAAEGAAVASSESEEEKEEAAVQSVRNAFAGLLDSESDGQANSEEEPEVREEEVVVEAPALAQPPPLAEATDEEQSGGGKKKKKKKGKKPAAAVEVDDEAALEQMLEVAAREKAAGAEASRLAGVWAVESRTLDAEAEQKKLFGARAVRAAQAEIAAEERGGGRNVRGGGAGSRAPKPRRVLLVEPPQSAGRPHGLLKMNLSAEAPVNTVGSPPCFRSQGEGVARSRLSAARASPMTSVLCTLGRWARPGRRSASSASSGRSGWC